MSWIGQFKYGDMNSREYQTHHRHLRQFLFLYDDRLVITYNFKGGTETITLKDVEAAYGSDLKAMSPPNSLAILSLQDFCFLIFTKMILFLLPVLKIFYINDVNSC